eukprot:5135071-Amphidinium_carterae.1
MFLPKLVLRIAPNRGGKKHKRHHEAESPRRDSGADAGWKERDRRCGQPIIIVGRLLVFGRMRTLFGFAVCGLSSSLPLLSSAILMDDGYVGGLVAMAHTSCDELQKRVAQLGLTLQPTKCEVVPTAPRTTTVAPQSTCTSQKMAYAMWTVPRSTRVSPVNAPDYEWAQAQLSIAHGGVRLHSAAQHSSAAYLASRLAAIPHCAQ